MSEVVVHLTDVTSRDDDVWVTGTIEGVADDSGEPRVFQGHAWNTHLVTLKDDDERKAYLAQQLVAAAREFLPRDPVPLAGPVALSFKQVDEVLKQAGT